MKLAILLQRLVDAVGHPHERELTERAQVPQAEVVAQCGIDLLRRIDVAVGHPSAQGLGRLVDQLDLIRGPNDCVRDRLLLLDPRDLLDDIVHGLEVLDVDGRDHLDAGAQQLFDVLPALRVARSRDVRVRKLIDQCNLRIALQQRVDVHLFERRAAILDPLPGNDLEIAELRGRVHPPVRLDEAHDHVRAPGVTALALVEHREGLPDAGSGSEVDAELPASHRFSLRSQGSVQRNIELEHVDARLAEESQRATIRVLVDELVHLGERHPPHLCDTARLDACVGDGDVGVETGTGSGDRVRGNLDIICEPVLLAVVSRPLLHQRRGSQGSSVRSSSRS